MTDRGIKDPNRQTSMFGVSSTDGTTPVAAEITASTKRLRTDSLSGGEYDTFAQDASTEATTTIEYEHHEIHGGSHYFVQSYADLAEDNVLDFTWQMPDTTKWIHWTWEVDTEAEFLWQVYENVVATNALANTVTPLNSNRNSTNTSATTMKNEIQANLAAANTDTNVTGGTLIGSGISGAGKKVSGTSERHHEIIMDQAKLYCLRGTATAAGYVNFDMHWYEHTDKN